VVFPTFVDDVETVLLEAEDCSTVIEATLKALGTVTGVNKRHESGNFVPA